MPSKTPKQARTMRVAAHDPAFAKRMDIPQKVAKDFVAADARNESGQAKAGGAKGGKSSVSKRK